MEILYEQALSVITNRRLTAEKNCNDVRDQLKKNIPEIRDIYSELENTASLILASLKKGGDSFEEIKKRNLFLQEQKKKILVKNGYSEDFDSIKYFCDKCHDSGYVGLDMCTCLKSELSRIRIENSEISKLSEKQTFDNFSLDYYPENVRDGMKFNFETLKSFAENFSENTKENLLLIGNTGLGKTHLSTAVGLTVIGNGYNVVYKSIQGIIEDMEEYHFKNNQNVRVDHYYDCDLLIIDDLGTELTNKFSLSVVYNIINTRLNSEKPMLINTNLNQNELREVYADRITSRLFGEFTPLLFKGTDIRRLKLSL